MLDAYLIIAIWCLFLGVFVGLFAGLLGIGGGLIIVPALSYLLSHFLNLPVSETMPVAIATSLSTVIFTGFSSARSHLKFGNIDWGIIKFCGVGIALGAVTGAHFATEISGAILQKIFAAFVILIALQMTFVSKATSALKTGKIGLTAVGLVTGFISALMGIGGGALLVPILVWLNINIRKAIGCAAVSGCIIAIFGTASFVYSGTGKNNLPLYSFGYVYLPALVGIVSTSMVTASLGVKLGQRVNVKLLKRIFAAFLVLVSIRMIVGME